MESGGVFRCEKCDRNMVRKDSYLRHLKSTKHNRTEIIHNHTKIVQNQNCLVHSDKNEKWNCICGKSYKYHPSYYTHRKKCNIYLESIKPNTSNTTQTQDISGETFTKEEILQLLITINKNQEESNKNQEESMKIMTDAIVVKISEISDRPTIVNNNSNNTNFNIQMFLNEDCKNAMNIQDFVQQLQITMTDLLSIKSNK